MKESQGFCLKAGFGVKYIYEYILGYMRKLRDKNTRKLMRLGKSSLALTLPKEMMDDLEWKEKQKVSIRRIKGGVVIRDWRK